MQISHGEFGKNSCTLCSAAAYCCGAVAPRAIAALLGRFLPRLGPLVFTSGPFFCENAVLFENAGFSGSHCSALFQRAVDRCEVGAEVGAETVDRRDDREGNAGGDQAVFNGSCARLI